MKSLFIRLATPTLICLMVIAAFGQDPGGTDSLAFGNHDGSPMNIFIDSDVAIPMWFKCDENVSFAHFCLATENLFVQSRLYFIPAGPFLDWNLEGTFPVDGWPEDGLTSQSVIGIADFSLPHPNYINTNGQWVLLGQFLVHTTSDIGAIGQTTDLMAGEDPVQGVTVIFDEMWTPIVPAMVFSSLVFLDAVPPVIVSPVADTMITANCHYPFQFSVVATDEDDEAITLTLELPIAGYTFTMIEDYPGYTNYRFAWTPPALPDTVIPGRIIATDINGLHDISNFSLNITPVEIFVTTDTTLPGYPAGVDLYLNQAGDNSHVGGFNLILQWDSSILSAQQVVFANDLADWAYTHIEYNPLGLGSIRLVGVANLEPGDTAGFTQGEHHLGTIYFLAANNPNLQGFTAELDMPINDYSYNVLSDSSGYLVYHPAITAGSVFFMDTGDILIGDVNLNSYPYETGDVVVYVAHLIDPVQNPFNPTQRFASDCNQDGITESIADLVYMLNVINNGGGGLTSGFGGSANLNIEKNSNSVTINLNSDFGAGGLLLKVNHDGCNIGNFKVRDGVKFEYTDVDGHLTAVFYSADLRQPLSSRLLEFEVTAGNPDKITIENFDISDINGNLLHK